MKPDTQKYPLPEGYEWGGSARDVIGVTSRDGRGRYWIWRCQVAPGKWEIRDRNGSGSRTLAVSQEGELHEALTFMSNYMLLGMQNEVS